MALGRPAASCQEVSKGEIIWMSGYQTIDQRQEHLGAY